ncbi:MAG TPA: iron-containing redox enzyme family protein [Pyrinomonadaceae bacterium]|nr:iron-containing redox enzyme family protein [Pyrinomonadaceae bacterium]
MHSDLAEKSVHAGNVSTLETRTPKVDYVGAAECFNELLKADNLDEMVRRRPAAVRIFERALEEALAVAYSGPQADALDNNNGGERAAVAAHLFLQRVLYRINRLKFFWYDDLSNYDNERSSYLRGVREQIEGAWHEWELSQLDAAGLKGEDVREALIERAARDVSPSPSASGLYFRDEVNEAGYRRLLAIASLDGLVEASQLSRTLGGVSNDIHAVMTRLLVEEYGGGRINRKHSTFFTAMLTELGMCTEAEAYFDLVPWEVLATINHSFLLSERKRFYLRYVGGLLYTEISVPAAFDNYRAAAERLHMSEAARGYWELHIREDERHGQWMLHDVALPLAARYPGEAWEIVLGYDQQKFLSERAGLSVERHVREAAREEGKDAYEQVACEEAA